MDGNNHNKVQQQIRERTLGYMTAAFGLVAGLAWNDAIKALIEELVPLGRDTILAKFVYAGGVTVIVVLLTVYLVRFFQRKAEKEDQ